MKTIINGVFVVLALVSPAWAQDSEADFLAVAEASEAAAVEANAALLAPGSYERGRKEIERARVASRNGENSERTREQLLQAKIFFDEAVAASQTAQITFSNALVVKEAAEIANAPELASDLWLKSEKELGAAASSLERNRIESALKQAEKSAELYGRAELAAIKTAVLAEAKQALQRAEQHRVQRYAPRTFAMVNELLAEAEQLLDQDRYNTKRARLLAQQATAEAGHSIFIAESVWMVRDKQLTLEELVLKWEERLQRVAVSAGVTLEMNRSSDDVAAELASRVAQLNRSEKSLREDFSDAQQYIAAQEEEIRDLDHKIRGASVERETLVL
jgi:hypothetical protein